MQLIWLGVPKWPFALNKGHRLNRSLLGLSVLAHHRLAVFVQDRGPGMQVCGIKDFSVRGPVASV